MTTPVLEARAVCTGYGALPVVTDLDLEVHAGEVVTIFGSNGAGKTTTLLALAGELPCQKGEVRLLGHPSRAPLHRRARRGLRFVTEERSIFPTLTTAENLRLGGGSPAKALEMVPELELLLKRPARLLSGGEQQILTLARALSGDPQVLLCDELSLGLAPLIVSRLLTAVRDAAARGVAVLMVEQQVRRALEIADRGYVMRRGTVVLEGTGTSLLAQIDDIEATYLSTHVVDDAAPAATGTSSMSDSDPTVVPGPRAQAPHGRGAVAG
jgi:branched-chain amino acid transport system ATP-binding protein